MKKSKKYSKFEINMSVKNKTVAIVNNWNIIFFVYKISINILTHLYMNELYYIID